MDYKKKKAENRTLSNRDASEVFLNPMTSFPSGSNLLKVTEQEKRTSHSSKLKKKKRTTYINKEEMMKM